MRTKSEIVSSICLAVVVILMMLLTNCGGGGDSGSGGQCITIAGNGTSGVSVSIVGPSNGCDTAFSPPILIVAVNTQVTWTNNDVIDHTVTSSNGCACSPGDALPVADRELNSPTIGQGQSFQHTFNMPGTYDYVCTIAGHSMRGRVVVQ